MELLDCIHAGQVTTVCGKKKDLSKSVLEQLKAEFGENEVLDVFKLAIPEWSLKTFEAKFYQSRLYKNYDITFHEILKRLYISSSSSQLQFRHKQEMSFIMQLLLTVVYGPCVAFLNQPFSSSKFPTDIFSDFMRFLPDTAIVIFDKSLLAASLGNYSLCIENEVTLKGYLLNTDCLFA